MKPTREQILAEPAGRQMDVWVAEYVMGLVQCTAPIHKSGIMLPCHASPDYPDQGGETHSYSTDIAAWEVVMKMGEQDWWCNIGNIIPNSDPIVWECAFHRGPFGEGNRVYGATEMYAPLAICRAALLAVLEDAGV